MSLTSSLLKKNSSSLEEKEVFEALESEDSDSASLVRLELLDLEDTLEALLDDDADVSSRESNDKRESESLEYSSECSIFRVQEAARNCVSEKSADPNTFENKTKHNSFYNATSPNLE